MLRLPGLSLLWDLIYDAVSRNRRALSTAFGLAACGIAPPPDVVEPEVERDNSGSS